jgi:hypothetical protein
LNFLSRTPSILHQAPRRGIGRGYLRRYVPERWGGKMLI